MTKAEILVSVERNINENNKVVYGNLNLHAMYVALTDAKFRNLHESQHTVVHIDGMPIVWLGRILGLSLNRSHRTTPVDWLLSLLKLGEKQGWRVYYLGSEPRVFLRGMACIKEKLPRLEIRGHHGFFDISADSLENDQIIAEIQMFKPHLLIIGMGMGRQERWIYDHLDQLCMNCAFTVGAWLEFVSGVTSTPPRWMGKLGLEWFFRFLSNPRRFAWRYLVEPWIIVGLLFKAKFLHPSPSKGKEHR